MRRISKHISYKEATRSATAKRLGIDNHPSENVLYRMQITANKIFEPVRIHFGVPIFVSSFFRSWKLNGKIGGSSTSDHPKGMAIDMDDVLSNENGPTNADIFYFILDNVDFDQLIWEYGNDNNPDWVHASYRGQDKNRCQVLKMVRYTDWLGRKRTRREIFVDPR